MEECSWAVSKVRPARGVKCYPFLFLSSSSFFCFLLIFVGTGIAIVSHIGNSLKATGNSKKETGGTLCLSNGK